VHMFVAKPMIGGSQVATLSNDLAFADGMTRSIIELSSNMLGDAVPARLRNQAPVLLGLVIATPKRWPTILLLIQEVDTRVA
jgi:hypothetical protein